MWYPTEKQTMYLPSPLHKWYEGHFLVPTIHFFITKVVYYKHNMNTYISKNTYVSYIHNKLISRKQRSCELKLRDIWKRTHERVRAYPSKHVNIIVARWHQEKIHNICKRVIYITNWFRANRGAVSWSRDIWKRTHERVKAYPSDTSTLSKHGGTIHQTTTNQSPVFYQLSLTSRTWRIKTGHRTWRPTLPYRALFMSLCHNTTITNGHVKSIEDASWAGHLQVASAISFCSWSAVFIIVGRFGMSRSIAAAARLQPAAAARLQPAAARVQK